MECPTLCKECGTFHWALPTSTFAGAGPFHMIVLAQQMAFCCLKQQAVLLGTT